MPKNQPQLNAQQRQPRLKSLPQGHFLGRLASGRGDAQLIGVATAAQGLATANTLAVPGGPSTLQPIASHTFLANTTASSVTPIATTITMPAAGLTIAYNVGNITYSLANDLAALEGLGSTGLAARTAADTWAQRVITGTAGTITVTNGDGVAGNPTLTIDATYVGQTSITTLGTIATGTWNAGVIAGQYGGTGVANTGKTITLGGNLTTSGAFATTLTVTALTNSTLPAGTHTLAGLDVAQTWSATQTSMTLATATLTGNTTLPNTSTLLGSTGQLILGNTANISIAGVSGMLAQITAPSGNAGLSVSRFSADVGAPAYLLGKSRGSISTAGAVVSGDGVGNFTWGGDDGSTNGAITIAAAKLQVLVDATVSTNIVPARFAFLTMNAAGTLAERARIDNAGSLLVGTTSGGGTAGNIVANGTVQANTAGSNFVDMVNKSILPCTAQLDKTTNVTLATITGLTTATLTAGKTYRIRGHIFCTSGATGGIQLQFTAAGGLTLTSARINCFGWNGATAVASTTTTAIGAPCFSQAAIVTDIDIDGMIVVNVTGTFSLQMAQNTSNATTTSVFINSFIEVDRANA